MKLVFKIQISDFCGKDLYLFNAWVYNNHEIRIMKYNNHEKLIPHVYNGVSGTPRYPARNWGTPPENWGTFCWYLLLVACGTRCIYHVLAFWFSDKMVLFSDHPYIYPLASWATHQPLSKVVNSEVLTLLSFTP